MKLTISKAIIKETIKRLIKEQGGGPTSSTVCMQLKVETCGGSLTPIGNIGYYPCSTIDGQVPTQNDVGRAIRNPNAPSGHPNTGVHKILEVNPVSGGNTNVFDVTEDECPTSTTSNCGDCDPSRWLGGNGMLVWMQTWTNNNAFQNVNNNPNQPCNHICGRIAHWENACLTAGPNHKNQLACKIQEGQNQAQIHNCNC